MLESEQPVEAETDALNAAVEGIQRQFGEALEAKEGAAWAAELASDPTDTSSDGGEAAGGKLKRDVLRICGIFHNEGPYLREWLTHHLTLGAQKMFL